MNDDVESMMTALGVLAETCLIFYRSVVNAGGDDEEACLLTSMYMDLCVHGNPGNATLREDGDDDD